MTDRPDDARTRVARARAVAEALNPAINALLWLNPEAEAMAAAAAGPLDGAPVLVKDCIDWAGLPTTHGSAVYRDAQPAAEDAEVVRRLRAAGATLLGKTHLSEFCFGATGENATFGNCRNPWDTARITGGSSSGSAAAVAAGIAPMAIGTDTGGSVRVPAALCGVVGLRPTLGRVSNHGVLDVSTICDLVGPFGATVTDAARLYAVIAGHDRRDPLSFDDPAPLLVGMEGDVRGLRVGLPRAFFYDGLQDCVADALDEAARVLERLGCTVVDVSLGDVETLRSGGAFKFVLADVADARRDVYPRHAARIGAEVVRRIELGHQVSGADYAHCIRLLQQFQRALRDTFTDSVDLLLTPTTPVTAPLWSESADMVATTRLVARNTYDIGAAGVPSLSVPCGFDRNGLPIGMQLTATWRAEALLFRVARAFEAATEHHRRRVPLTA
ncbi:amidase [Parapedomonas caeni]